MDIRVFQGNNRMMCICIWDDSVFCRGMRYSIHVGAKPWPWVLKSLWYASFKVRDLAVKLLTDNDGFTSSIFLVIVYKHGFQSSCVKYSSSCVVDRLGSEIWLHVFKYKIQWMLPEIQCKWSISVNRSRIPLIHSIYQLDKMFHFSFLRAKSRNQTMLYGRTVIEVLNIALVLKRTCT